MSDVEIIALWTGLFASIAGIVLSIVAIVFAVLVNNRSQKVSDQTIQSLQKIESSVGRLSEDTQGLIKAGWDKMLGSVGSVADSESDGQLDAKALAAGVAAELRADLELGGPKPAAEVPPGEDQENQVDAIRERLERAVARLEQSLAGQVQNLPRSRRPSRNLDHLMARLNDLSPAALAFLSAIRARHIERDEYEALLEGPFADAILELRSSGLVTPLVHTSSDGSALPCYYYPRSMSRLMPAGLHLADDHVSPALAQTVREELLRAGYPERALPPK